MRTTLSLRPSIMNSFSLCHYEAVRLEAISCFEETASQQTLPMTSTHFSQKFSDRDGSSGTLANCGSDLLGAAMTRIAGNKNPWYAGFKWQGAVIMHII